MLKATELLLSKFFEDAQLIVVFGFTPWATYIHKDGVITEEIIEDPDFQNANAGRWVIIEVLEGGGYKITSDEMFDTCSQPSVMTVDSMSEVIGFLSS